MTQFYVYEHWRPDTGKCFYVGKGSGRRAFDFRHRNRHHKAVVSKLSCCGLTVDVRILFDELSEADALRIEAETVAAHRVSSVCLANLADGGAGATGYRHTEEAKAVISSSGLGRKHTPETIEKMRDSKRGISRPRHVIDALLAGRRAKGQSAEEREKRRIRMTGTRHSEETKALLSAQKMGNKNALGFKQTPVTRERMRMAALLREERKRAGYYSIQATT